MSCVHMITCYQVTKLSLISITRQSDNIRRMYAMLEERQFQVNITKFVDTIFLLPTSLSRRYASLLFVMYSKFNITSKKRLMRVSCSNFEKCSSVIMAFLLPDNNLFNSVVINYRSDPSSPYLPGKFS